MICSRQTVNYLTSLKVKTTGATSKLFQYNFEFFLRKRLTFNPKPSRLLHIHLIIRPFPSHKLLMSAAFGYTAPVKNDNPVGKANIRETMTYQYCRPAPDYLPEPAEDLIFGVGIQGA